MKRRWSVALCGYYGMGNLGDDLLAEACIGLLVKEGVSRDAIVLFSGKPSESEKTHGVHAVNRWSLSTIWQTLKNSETLLLGGGGLFQDVSSLRNSWFYWGIVKLASMAGCRIWAFGQTIGPLKTGCARFAAKSAFSHCLSIGVRDIQSADWLKKWNLTGRMTCDPVLGTFQQISGCKKKYFLVNFRPDRNNLAFRAARAFSALKLPPEVRKIGVAMANEDAKLLSQLDKETNMGLEKVLQLQTKTIEPIFSNASWAFGMRLHFGVLSLLSGVPLSLVPYDPKVSAFAVAWGIRQWTGGVIHLPETALNISSLSQVRLEMTENFKSCFTEAMG